MRKVRVFCLCTLLLAGKVYAIDTTRFVDIGAQLSAAIEKSTAASVTSSESIATYRAKKEVNRAASKSDHSVENHADVCQTLEQSAGLRTKGEVGKRAAMKESSSWASSNINNTDPTVTVISLRNKGLGDYATDSDLQRYNIQEQSRSFPGGDMNSSLLYGTQDGNETYSVDQARAVDNAIARKTQLSRPKSLPAPINETTSDGLVYRETQREYGAYMSGPQAAYLFIKNSHMEVSK